MNRTPVAACWWIIGRDNRKQLPAVAIDLYDDKGELTNPNGETFSAPLADRRIATARKVVRLYAKHHHLRAADVSFDGDSTEHQRND